jgi:hypothetical protein
MNIYYRFRTALFFLYPLDRFVDRLFRNSLYSGIKELKKDTHHIEVTFNDGVTINAWNANKWYAWLSHNGFVHKEGKLIHKWNDVRPSAKTMFKLNRAMKRYDK